MATVVKNFKVKNGIVIEGATGTLNGSNLVTETATQTLSNKTLGSALNADSNSITNLAAPTSNADAATKLYSDTVSTAAETAAIAYTDARETAITASYQTYADTAESDAITAANLYTDGEVLALDTSLKAYADQAESDAVATSNSYTDGAISNLVDGAPALLDTLNELAAALGDDENFATTITGTISSGDASTLASANTYTDGEISTVNTTIDGLTTTDIAEGSALYFTAARAVDAVEAVVPNFTEVDINSVATQVAAQVSVATAGQATVYSFSKTLYRSAELIVKASTSDHTEITKVLLTLDGLDNIAITEYGTVGTNGTLFTVTAALSGDNVNILATTTSNTTNILVSGTLLV